MDCIVKIFGCSHSFHGPFSPEINNKNISELKKEFISKGYENVYFINAASSGNANDKIIDSIYNEAEDDLKKGMDIFYIIQYSYLNRLWLPNKIDMTFHTAILDEKYGEWAPHIPNEMKPFLKNIYEGFIACFYDDELYFNNLLKNIHLVKSYLDVNKIKFIHFLWETGPSAEEMVKSRDEFYSLYKDGKLKYGNSSLTQIKKMKKLELIEFEENVFNFTKISFDKKLTNWHTFGGGNYDLHLTTDGNNFLKNILLNKINEKLQ